MARPKRPNSKNIFVGVEIDIITQSKVKQRILKDLGVPVSQKIWLKTLLCMYADDKIEMLPSDVRSYTTETNIIV